MAKEHWVGTWAVAPAPAEGVALNNVTLRMNGRISLGGKILRVRLTNAHGTKPLAIGAAHIGLRAGGAAVVPASNRKLTFGGEASAAIPTGALLISDPLELEVPALADIAVTVHLPQDLPASFGLTGRYARVTNYLSPLGNFADADVMPVGKITDDWHVVAGIDVLAEAGTGGIVALGDSLTDGNIATHDAWANWPSQLARRLVARRNGRPMGVMNQGLGGNRILHDIRGDSGLRRFDRDVLAQPGVTHVIVLLGTNDLRNRWAKPEEEANAPALIAGLKQFALRAHARGIKIFAGTITPFENETFLPGAWTPARERIRQDVNAWIRTGNAFDTVIDFDAGVRDPDRSTSMLPMWDCGDHLHQSDAGYNHMGDIIDLGLFE
ncbi:MAG TPA: SGNH/GDSL hydrolase family protein [Acetobacteraceae bacterium]|jgi:lysophospholipase L1-like esterase|nr:SGNH/GDSL hydrolase family protein [Acetobacteraceae bacterium]